MSAEAPFLDFNDPYVLAAGGLGTAIFSIIAAVYGPRFLKWIRVADYDEETGKAIKSVANRRQ